MIVMFGRCFLFFRRLFRICLLYTSFHIADPIRFENKFRMTLDNMGWTGPRYDDYTSVAYWLSLIHIFSSGQVLQEPYDYEKTKLIVREMTDLLVLDLVDKLSLIHI